MLHSTFYRTIPLQQKKPWVVFDQVKLPHDNKVTAITWHLHCWNPVTMNCHGEVHSQPLIQIDQLLRLLSRSSYWPEKSLLHSFTVRTPCKKCPRVSLISFLVLKGRGWGAKQGGSNFFFSPWYPFSRNGNDRCLDSPKWRICVEQFNYNHDCSVKWGISVLSLLISAVASGWWGPLCRYLNISWYRIGHWKAGM